MSLSPSKVDRYPLKKFINVPQKMDPCPSKVIRRPQFSCPGHSIPVLALKCKKYPPPRVECELTNHLTSAGSPNAMYRGLVCLLTAEAYRRQDCAVTAVATPERSGIAILQFASRNQDRHRRSIVKRPPRIVVHHGSVVPLDYHCTIRHTQFFTTRSKATASLR
jgi:hypothetical protein